MTDEHTDRLRRNRRLGMVRWMGVLALGLAWAACARQEAPARPAPPPPIVTVTPVEKMAIAESDEYVGRTESVSTVDLRARVTGYLVKRTFDEGADVRKGQLLYVIEQEPYQAAVEAAEAAVAQTEATLENARKYLGRLNTVKDAGGASKANLDSSEGTVLETRALLKQRQAQLVQAKLNLGYTEIRAPISGRIGRTAIHVGNLVGPDSGVLATIVRLDPMWVTFPISERDYLALQEELGAGLNGRRAIPQLVPTIRLVDGSVFPHPGRIDFQDNRVDEATGTILLRATFPNPRLLLRPGQFVTVIQSRREKVDRLLIPQAAVQRDQVGPFVMVVNQQKKAEMRRVQLGDVSGTKWIVMEGLNEGESVISDGLQKVTAGAEVDARPATATEVGEDTSGDQ
ncbi:MAG: efflux RND transporter periplasmic adaptor subunit [Acidobacteriota bacterium]